MRTTILAWALLASASFGQVAWVLTDGQLLQGGEPSIHGMTLPSAAFPSPNVTPPPQNGALVITPLAGGAPSPAGGAASDQATGIDYLSDGTSLMRAGHAFNSTLGFESPVPAPIPTPITGLAFDSASSTLFAGNMTDVFLLPDQPPYTAGLSFPVPGLLAALSGLGFDPGSGTLWACDVHGNIYHFTTSGVPLGTQPVATRPSPSGADLRGLAINSTTPTGVMFPCPRDAAPRVMVTDGIAIYDALDATVPDLTFAAQWGAPSTAYGLAFSNDAQRLFFNQNGVSLLSWVDAPPNPGNGATLRLQADPQFANQTAVVFVDACPASPPPLLFVGQRFAFDPSSPTLAIGGEVVDAMASASIPVPASALPTGAEFVVQWVLADPLHFSGFALSDAFCFTIGTN